MTIHDFILGMPEKTFDKDMKKRYEDAKKLLKKSGGGAFLLMALPNITEEQHEKWALGEKLECVNLAVYSCNDYTLSALINMLKCKIGRILKDNSEVMMLDVLSQIKSRMIIDEEDLKNGDES